MSVAVRIFEGYIRNRQSLVDELGLSLFESSDIDRKIIIEGYKRWGYDLANHLYGGFAIVIHDEDRNETFCIRDHFGVQSLYYYESDDVFLCDISLTGILRDDRYKKALDHEAVQNFMIFGYPVGERTLYRGIRKLMPGRYLIYRDGKCRIERYYIPSFIPQENVDEDKWTGLINETLETILNEDRGNCDFEHVNAFLSGGVDSAYLLAASGVKTSCGIGYTDDKACEWKQAGRLASFVGANFKRIEIKADEFFASVPDYVRRSELPTSDPSSLAFFIGCGKLAREGVKVCLSGEGADEFFAGYHIYRKYNEVLTDGYYGCFGVMEKSAALKLLKYNKEYDYHSLLDDADEVNTEDPLSRMLATDISLWFEGDILFGVRNAARSSGIKLLLPYSDRRMFELSSRIPSNLKLNRDIGKYIFRKAASYVIPEETAWRPKAGFPVPVNKWMHEESVRGRIEDVLFGRETSHLFDTEVLRKYWDSFLNGNGILYQVIYTAYVLEVWYQEVFLRGDGSLGSDRE